jgi:hypothetical protein
MPTAGAHPERDRHRVGAVEACIPQRRREHRGFGAFIRKQNDEYGRIIREANIKEE